MRRKVVIRIIETVTFATIVTVAFGNGCSQDFKAMDQSTIGVDVPGSVPSATSSSDYEVIPGTKTASLAGTTEILNHLTSCSGVAVPSDLTQSTYEAKKGSISVTGAANTVTSPMLMAVANIAGEVCNDLINQEVRSGARIFQGVSFAANSLPGDAVLSDAITRLALSCWQRRDSDSERAMLLSMVNSQVSATENMASRKASLMLCTAMLSSLDAIMN